MFTLGPTAHPELAARANLRQGAAADAKLILGQMLTASTLRTVVPPHASAAPALVLRPMICPQQLVELISARLSAGQHRPLHL
jgi:hypothetical protein